jgi:DNA mismatch repair protein MutL
MDNLTTELSEDGRDFAAKGKERLAAQLARSGAAGRREQLNNLEAQTLVDSLFACKEPNYSPSGKKCFAVVDSGEIEQRFF